MTQVNFVDITYAQAQQIHGTADIYHKTYSTISLKHKHLDMICAQVS